MLRRVIMAAGSLAVSWALLGQVAGAQLYPPVPQAVTTTVAPKKVPPAPVVAPTPVVKKVVVVRGAPVAPRRAFAVTGAAAAPPLTALATASVGLGVALLCLARIRHPRSRRRLRSRRHRHA